MCCFWPYSLFLFLLLSTPARMVDSPKSKLTSTSGDWTSCPLNIFESQVVWKTFRSSLAGENLLLELYSPYRPQHRTHLVVPWLQLHGPKTGPWKRWVGTNFESISCKFGVFTMVCHIFGLPWFPSATCGRCWIWWQRRWQMWPPWRCGDGRIGKFFRCRNLPVACRTFGFLSYDLWMLFYALPAFEHVLGTLPVLSHGRMTFDAGTGPQELA